MFAVLNWNRVGKVLSFRHPPASHQLTERDLSQIDPCGRHQDVCHQAALRC
jgi:hypothetical protein